MTSIISEPQIRHFSPENQVVFPVRFVETGFDGVTQHLIKAVAQLEDITLFYSVGRDGTQHNEVWCLYPKTTSCDKFVEVCTLGVCQLLELDSGIYIPQWTKGTTFIKDTTAVTLRHMFVASLSKVSKNLIALEEGQIRMEKSNYHVDGFWVRGDYTDTDRLVGRQMTVRDLNQYDITSIQSSAAKITIHVLDDSEGNFQADNMHWLVIEGNIKEDLKKLLMQNPIFIKICKRLNLHPEDEFQTIGVVNLSSSISDQKQGILIGVSKGVNER